MEARKALETLLPFILTITVIGALLEFILLRLLLRVGAFAPSGETFNVMFSVLLTGGLAARNVALIAAAVSVASIALLLWRGIIKRSLAAILWSILALGFLLLAFRGPLALLVLQVLGLAALVPLILLHPEKRSWDFVGSCAIVAALASTFYYQADLNASSLGLGLLHAPEVFSGGEILAVAAPILLLPDRRWRWWAAPLAVAAAVIYVMVSSYAFVPLIAVWTVYITLFLPAPVYAVAAGAYVYDLADMLSRRSLRWMGYGLLLVALAGRVFQDTYLSFISLVGVLLIVLPASALVTQAAPARPASAPADEEGSQRTKALPTKEERAGTSGIAAGDMSERP